MAGVVYVITCGLKILPLRNAVPHLFQRREFPLFNKEGVGEIRYKKTVLRGNASQLSKY